MYKVCHLTSVHRYKDTRIFLKECRSLSNEYEVHLVAPDAPNEIIDNVHVHGIRKDYKNRLQRATQTTKSVYEEALKIDADLYHFHDPELIFTGLKLKKQGKAVIYDVHEDVPEQILSKHWIPKPLRKLISFSMRKLEKYASKRFSGVVTATPTIEKRFKTYNANTVTIRNYPLLNELASVRKSDQNKDEFNAIYIGGIHEIRGIREMVNAVAKANQESTAKLLLAGNFSPAELEDEIKAMPGFKYVDYLGWLNRDEVKHYLEKSSVGLVLLHPEPRFLVSYPIKLFEYMSSGIPVITSNFPVWEAIVNESNCGKCVDPLNIDEIASTILWFKNNPDMAQEMGRNGRKAIEQKYNWETESKSLIKLYQGVLNS